MLKIYDETSGFLRESQIGQHLSEFVVADVFNCFGIYDDCVFDFEVGDVFVDFDIAVDDWVAGLLTILNAEVLELDD